MYKKKTLSCVKKYWETVNLNSLKNRKDNHEVYTRNSENYLEN